MSASKSQAGPGHPAPPGGAGGKPLHVHAFGIDVDVADKHAVEKPPMSRNAKWLIWLGVVVLVGAGVMWWERRPDTDLDSEAANNADVRQVVELERKADRSGLAQLARSTDPVVARRAVTSLGNIGAGDEVRSVLTDTRTEVRTAALSAMGRAPTVEQLPTLAKAMREDPESTVRVVAMRGVANVPDFSIFDQLVPMLSDPDPSVRKAAIGAIEDRIGLKFSDYQADGSAADRAKAIIRIRATVPLFRQRFDNYLAHQRERGEGR